MSTKTCKRCGRELPIDHFRQYYGGRSGTYSFCKTCERIEQRRKYLVAKGTNLSVDEAAELAKIDELYGMREAAGLHVPKKRESGGVTSVVDQLITGMK